MKSVTAAVSGAILFAMASAPSQAADEVVLADTGYFDWSGPYAGAQIGYIWGKSTFLFTGGDYAPLDPDGFTAGVFAGVNYAVSPNLIAGVDADINYSAAHGGSVYYAPGGVPFLPNDRADADINWTGALRARAGVPVGQALVYAAAGLAVAGYHFERFTPGDAGSHSDTRVGWTAGVGADVAIAPMWFARFEYRYSDYGSKSYPASLFGTGQNFSVDLKTHEAKFGVAKKF